MEEAAARIDAAAALGGGDVEDDARLSAERAEITAKLTAAREHRDQA